jgi:hypothetical protein
MVMLMPFYNNWCKSQSRPINRLYFSFGHCDWLRFAHSMVLHSQNNDVSSTIVVKIVVKLGTGTHLKSSFFCRITTITGKKFACCGLQHTCAADHSCSVQYCLRCCGIPFGPLLKCHTTAVYISAVAAPK